MKRRTVLQGLAALFVLPYIKAKAAIQKRSTGGWVRCTLDENGTSRFYISNTSVGTIPKKEDWIEQTELFQANKLEINIDENGYVFRIPNQSSKKVSE